MTYSTGNPDRDQKIIEALAFCARLHDAPTLANVQAALARFPGFDLDQDELDGMLAATQRQSVRERADARAKGTTPLEHAGPLLIETLPNGTPVPQALPETLNKTGSPHATATEQPHQDMADATPAREISPAEGRHILQMEKRGLDQARERLLVAQHTLKERRNDFENAKMVWARLDQPVTVSGEVQARQFIADSQAEARARKAGKIKPKPQNLPGKSYIDRAAYYGLNKNDANDYARSRHQNGGSHRGAFPGKSAMGQINHDPRRGPTPQPPSEKPSTRGNASGQ